MKKLINLIRAWKLLHKLHRFNKLTDFKHFKRECRHADEMAHFNNKRYRVYFGNGYIALNRDEVIELKKTGEIDKAQNTGILSNVSFYDTQTKANTHPEFSNRKL